MFSVDMRNIGRIIPHMATVEHIILLLETYAAAIGRSDRRVSTVVFNRGGRIDSLRAGADLTTRQAERAMQWFSANWPAGVDWPEGVPRPAPEAPDCRPPTAEARPSGTPSSALRAPSPARGEGVCGEAAE
jgi:hypothetical protein